MIFTNKVYDILKFIAQIVLPALATFYITIAGIWSLPCGEEISGTIMAIDTLLGALLAISTSSYNKQLAEESETESSVADPSEEVKTDGK